MPLAPLLLAFLAPAADSAPSLQARLDLLIERLEERRQAHHVPGMAIAVVRDGRVVLSRGFGLADVERGVPATEATRFAAGSTTKAFTAALIGMLADDGAMDFDDPVRRHLPWFHLTDPQADAEVTLRDLMCHRLGFASMSLLWYGREVTSREVLDTAMGAELLYPFRSRFNYSNVSFLAAGEAAAAAGGASWHELLRRRLLEPLGMTTATTSLAEALADPGMAEGYRWDDAAGALVHQPMRDVSAVAPAGALNASARDMGRWVTFQLGRGVIDGKRLLSADRLAETWTPQITVDGEVAYGLGWFLRTWRGHDVIEHAGGIDGFTAEVAMVPDEGVGFALLMNLFASPLQDESRSIVFDTLLGDTPASRGTPEPGDLSPYVGTYVGNFAQFHEAAFEVVVHDGQLALDVPGQTLFDLVEPDDDGKRAFAVAEQIQVRFNADADGAVRSMTLFQSGREFVLPRAGEHATAAEPPGDLPPAAEVMARALAARGDAATLRSIRMDGTVRFVHLGVSGTVSILAGADGALSEVYDLGRFGAMRTTIADGRGSVESALLASDDLDPEHLEQVRINHPFTWLRDWTRTFDGIRVVERLDEDGRPLLAVRLDPPLGPPQLLVLDEATWLPVRHETTIKSVAGPRVPATVRYTAWREADGVVMPAAYEIETAITGRMAVTIDTVTTR